MGIEPKSLTHKASSVPLSHGSTWFERPYMYLIKYIYVNIVYHSYRILFIAVSIKNIVDMSGNKQFVKTCTPSQPPSHIAVAKTRYATCHAANKLRNITHARHTPSRHNAICPVRAANFSNFRQFSHFFSTVI